MTTRHILIQLSDDTTDAECGGCLMSCCDSHCEAFGDKPYGERHPDCIAAEHTADVIVKVARNVGVLL